MGVNHYSITKRTFHYECSEADTSKCGPTTLTLKPGKYCFDLYGASGGSQYGGYGARASASFTLKDVQTFYLYIGGRGSVSNKEGKIAKGGFNGGGNGGAGHPSSGEQYHNSGTGGGGATDVRLQNGIWNNVDSLNSRIIVAGGGGGYSQGQAGGYGGGLEGGATTPMEYYPDSVRGGNQTHGGGFGFGQSGISKTSVNGVCGSEGNGGGGGGWFGGYASQKAGPNSDAAGGGGSSFISGNLGFVKNDKFQFEYSFIENGSITKYQGDGYIELSQINYYSPRACWISSSVKRVFSFFIAALVVFK